MPDYKDRQGNYSDILEDVDKNKPDSNPDPYAYEAVPEQFKDNANNTEEVTQTPKKSDQILNSINQSAAPPKPEYNESLQQRRERVAKLNAASRGFSVLGDILSLATGANVNRRQPDQITPVMLQSYQSYLQDYDNKMDNYAYRRYRDELANKRLLYQDAIRGEAIERENRRHEDLQEHRDRTFEFQKERYKEPWELDGFNNEADWVKWNNEVRQQEIRDRQTMNRYRDGLTTDRLRSPEGSGYAHTVLLSNGNQKELTEAQFSQVRDEALRNAEALALNPGYKHLFEVEVLQDKEGADVRDENGEPVIGYKVKRNVKDEDLVRAYLEMQEGRQISPGDKMYRTGMELDERTPQRQPEYSTGGFY